MGSGESTSFMYLALQRRAESLSSCERGELGAGEPRACEPRAASAEPKNRTSMPTFWLAARGSWLTCLVLTRSWLNKLAAQRAETRHHPATLLLAFSS